MLEKAQIQRLLTTVAFLTFGICALALLLSTPKLNSKFVSLKEQNMETNFDYPISSLTSIRYYQSLMDSIIDFANSADFNRRRIEETSIKLDNIPEEYRKELEYSNLLHGSNPMQNVAYDILSNALSHMYRIAGVIHRIDPENPNNTVKEYCMLIFYYRTLRLSAEQSNKVYSKLSLKGNSNILNDEWIAWRENNCY